MRITPFILSLLLLNASVAFATVQIGNITIKDDGKIVFSDNSEQATATLKGDLGPQGPKGDEGPPGQVKKDELCLLYANEGVRPPAFCSNKKMFITSQNYDGNLGGLSGADAKCQDAATAGGLTGTFKAWLSDSTTSAKDRLSHGTGAYIRTDGAIIADDWLDLTDRYIKNRIMCDEFRDCSYGYSDSCAYIFTDTTPSGATADPNYPPHICNDWTTDVQLVTLVRVGNTCYQDERWTYDVQAYCDQFYKLMCIQQ